MTPPPGTPAPSTNLPGPNGSTWLLRRVEDFNTDVTLGGFVTMTTGDQGMLNPAYAGGAAYAASWKAKQAESLDTDGNARYSAQRTMSVADSILSIDLHTEGGIAYGSAVKLLGQSATDTNFTGYCRYSIRMRALTAGVAFGQVSRYGMANMLINNNNWPEWGEHDWPERKLDSVAMGGFYHPAQATNTSIGVLAPTGTRFADWHTWTIEWFPEGAGARIRWFCDDTLCYDTSAFVITAPPAVHGALIQAASNGGVPTPGETARLEIDWVALHTYSP